MRALHRWDTRRAQAYAAGSPAALSSLYVRGSVAGRADVVLLDRYRRRGVRVVGLRSQLLSVRVLDGHRDRLRLRVVDRVVGAFAVRGPHRVHLPLDRPSVRTITLVRRGSPRWRVAAVTAA